MVSFTKNVENICYDTFSHFFLTKEFRDKWAILNDTNFLPKNPFTHIFNFCDYIKYSLEQLQKYCETIKINDSKMILNI